MSKNDILSYLIQYIKKEFNIDNDLDQNSDLQVIGLDSLDIVTLLFNIEEKYGVKIPDEEIEEKGLLRLGAMADHVAKSLEG